MTYRQPAHPIGEIVVLVCKFCGRLLRECEFVDDTSFYPLIRRRCGGAVAFDYIGRFEHAVRYIRG